jgi:hypothetical protein
MSRYKRCPRCKGSGTHVNEAVDGFSAQDECAQDPEFLDNYFRGVYDVFCTGGCNGTGRILDTPDARAQRQLDWEWEQERKAERRALGY